MVWSEVVRLLEDPSLITAELDRRLAAARAAEPTRRRQESLERELVRVTKSVERLVTAYQEGLLSLEELRDRLPDVRRREQGVRAELQSLTDQAADQTATLRLAETLSAFLTRLRSTAQTLDIIERQRGELQAVHICQGRRKGLRIKAPDASPDLFAAIPGNGG